MNKLAVIKNYSDLESVAKVMYESGYFQDSKSAAQAMVKILAGQELGVGPFASMSGINIIKGKPAPGSNMIAALIKNDPRYDYKVKQLNNDICELTFFEETIQVGVSIFTKADLDKAEGGNMVTPGAKGSMKVRFPRNMLFARAISNGAKWYTPGIFGGAPVYTPEELGADVDEDGNVVTVEVVVEEPTQDTKTDKKEDKKNGRPWTLEKLREMIAKKAATYPENHLVDEKIRQKFSGCMNITTRGKRVELQVALGLDQSVYKSDQRLLQAVIDWTGFRWDHGTAKWMFSEHVLQEIDLVIAKVNDMTKQEADAVNKFNAGHDREDFLESGFPKGE